MRLEGFESAYESMRDLQEIGRAKDRLSSGYLYEYLMEMRTKILEYVNEPEKDVSCLAEAVRKLDAIEYLCRNGWTVGVIKRRE